LERTQRHLHLPRSSADKKLVARCEVDVSV
jgi:hypothetical protein